MASTCTPTTTLSVASNTKIQSIKELVDAGLCHVPSNYIRPPNERPHFQIDVNPIVECETIPVINLANMFGIIETISSNKFVMLAWIGVFSRYWLYLVYALL